MRTFKLLVITASLLFMTACRPSRPERLNSAINQDGDGVVICFARKQAVWVTIRATPEGRVIGWKEGVVTPAYVSYPSRGFNPAFTQGVGRVAWVDGNKILGIDDSSGKYVSPHQEVTAAILIPEGMGVGLQSGDQICLIANKEGRP